RFGRVGRGHRARAGGVMPSILSGTVIEPRGEAKLTFGLPESTRLVGLDVRATYEPEGPNADRFQAVADVALRQMQEIRTDGFEAPWLLAVWFYNLNEK